MISGCNTTGFFEAADFGSPNLPRTKFETTLKCGLLSLQNSAVDRTLKDHFEWLQGRLETLNSQIMECSNREHTNDLQWEIRAIELAIAHFEAALRIEKRITSRNLIRRRRLSPSYGNVLLKVLRIKRASANLRRSSSVVSTSNSRRAMACSAALMQIGSLSGLISSSAASYSTCQFVASMTALHV